MPGPAERCWLPPAPTRPEAPVAPRTSERSPVRCRRPSPGRRSPTGGRLWHRSPLPCSYLQEHPKGRGARILPRDGATSAGFPPGKPRSCSPGDARGPRHRAAAASPGVPAAAGGGSAQSGVGPAGAAAPQTTPPRPSAPEAVAGAPAGASRPHDHHFPPPPNHHPPVSFIPCGWRRGSGQRAGRAHGSRAPSAPFRAVPCRAVPARPRPARRPRPGPPPPPRSPPRPAAGRCRRGSGGARRPRDAGSLSPAEPPRGGAGPAARLCPGPGGHLRAAGSVGFALLRSWGEPLRTGGKSGQATLPSLGELARRAQCPVTITAAGGSPRSQAWRYAVKVLLGHHADSISTSPSSAQREPTGLAIAHRAAVDVAVGSCTLGATTRSWALHPEHSHTPATRTRVPASAGSLQLAQQSLVDGKTLDHMGSKLQGLHRWQMALKSLSCLQSSDFGDSWYLGSTTSPPGNLGEELGK